MAGWQSGYAAACKAVDAGSIPTPASIWTCVARVVKLVDTADLKSAAYLNKGRAGSIPAPGTKFD
jgi:hypothetical protein